MDSPIKLLKQKTYCIYEAGEMSSQAGPQLPHGGSQTYAILVPGESNSLVWPPVLVKVFCVPAVAPKY